MSDQYVHCTCRQQEDQISLQQLEFYPSMSNPSKNHWMGVKQFYNTFHNKGTLNYGLKFSVHGEETHL